MLAYIVITFLCLITPVISEDKLIHVHALWRHGERNPRRLFHGDLNNASAFPEGLDQLTTNGINQFFNLGQYFRSRYVYDNKLLSSEYKHSEVYARSTDVDRTKVSAMAFYSGLYSNSTNNEYLLAPVPIHTVPSADDFLYLLSFKCQRLSQLLYMTDNSQHIKALLQKHHTLLAEVSEKTRIPISYYQSIFIFDTTTIEKSFGLPIPAWVTKEKSEEFDQLFVDYVSTQYGFVPFLEDSFSYDLQLELAKISCGPLMAEIVDRLILKIQCSKNDTPDCVQVKDQKLYTYSGHDITVVELFGGLGFKKFAFEQQTLPSYAATIILELWEDEAAKNVAVAKEGNQYDYYYVKIFYYQNSSVKESQSMGEMLPECQGKKGCPLQYLIKRAELLRPKPDLKSYCNEAVMSSATKVDYNSVMFVFIIFYFCWDKK